MSKLSELHKFNTLHTFSKNQWNSIVNSLAPLGLTPVSSVIDPTSLIGIEVEMENAGGGNIDTLMTGDIWHFEADNSLRDNGIEAVSAPLLAGQAMFALALLDKVMGPAIRFSHRTSVHIHLNVRDMSPDEISKLLLVYLAIERLLFKFVGEHRERGIFCVPLFNLQIPEVLFKELQNFNTKGVRHIQANEYRYSALNFEKLLSYGTVEFRHMGGTRDMERIATWINMILSLKKFIMNHTLDEIKKELVDLNTNSQFRVFAQRVLGDYFYAIPYTDVERDVEQGVLSVKRSILTGEFASQLYNTSWDGSPAYLAYRQFLGKNPVRIKTVSPLEALAAQAHVTMENVIGAVNAAQVGGPMPAGTVQWTTQAQVAQPDEITWYEDDDNGEPN